VQGVFVVLDNPGGAISAWNPAEPKLPVLYWGFEGEPRKTKNKKPGSEVFSPPASLCWLVLCFFGRIVAGRFLDRPCRWGVGLSGRNRESNLGKRQFALREKQLGKTKWGGGGGGGGGWATRFPPSCRDLYIVPGPEVLMGFAIRGENLGGTGRGGGGDGGGRPPQEKKKKRTYYGGGGLNNPGQVGELTQKHGFSGL